MTAVALIPTAYHTSDATSSRDAGAPTVSPLLALARPQPLSAAEEQDPAALALARRFNPAMSLPIHDVWPVEVRYAWHDGADLVAHGRTPEGAMVEKVVVANRDLSRRDWSDLPHQSPEGFPIRYFIDAPGDDRMPPGSDRSHWRRRFESIAQQGPAAEDPTRSPYPPTQYVHLYWWNRERGLLAIQYWFYYPFNEWVNNHEGDWERFQVVVAGPPTLAGNTRAFSPLGYQFFFHESWLETQEVVRHSPSGTAGEHPVIFVGGEGRFWSWGGPFSGGSYPQPGIYPNAGFRPHWLAPADDVSQGARFIEPEQFQIVLLPEPERLERRPELSWLRLPFFAGQPSVHHNPVGYRTFGRDAPPIQPAIRPGWLQPPQDGRWAFDILPPR